ncbi:MAG: methyltransferase family protein [Thermodesulfobacteriota bacterium]
MSVPYWVFRIRNFLACPPLLFAFVCTAYEIEANEIIWPLGVSVVALGVALRIWAQQHVHHRVIGHKQLTTTGPYEFVRNPLYIGNTILCVGGVIASELLWLIPITLFWCFGIYSIVIRYEEEHLLKKYGDPYRSYLSEVPRWFPKISSVRNRPTGWVNQYLYRIILVEVSSGLLILFPYILKEILYG